MDEFVVWIIAIGFLSVIASVVWWVLVAIGMFKLAKSANAQFESQLEQAMRALAQLQNSPRSPADRSTIEAMSRLAGVSERMRQLDQLAQQRYEVKMGELAGMAANAGLNWSPDR